MRNHCLCFAAAMPLLGHRVFLQEARILNGNAETALGHRPWVACNIPARSIRVWRPSLDDVERLSRGQAAKHRGTGSRAVPHRLNAEESAEFGRARQKGFVTLRGNGYRRERKGSPLANIWRMWSDASMRPTISIYQSSDGQVCAS